MAAPAQNIGPYRITSKLGAGGMGEVWRATDTRLNREVAIKVLPHAFAADPMRMGRFAREAKLLASLNHPGIAVLYGVEERALIMEMVEGQTLAEKMARGPLPLEEALPIATQMAEALEYAHEKGVVHRDLKPANIKITPTGRVKILDFGLAKAMSVDASASVAAEAATLSSPGTMPGAILGTAAYMAPEQARGQNVDRRADIWAFGVVLYEMLTGERPFAGPTISDILAAVLKSQPSFAKVPAAVRPVVQGCLRKDPRQRWRDMGDVRLGLEGQLLTEVDTLATPVSRTPGARWAGPAVFAVLGIALAVGAGLWWRPPASSPPVTTWDIELPPGQTFGGLSVPDVAISPDGRFLAYSALQNQSIGLYLRRLQDGLTLPVSGGQRGEQPFFSPDSRWLAFVGAYGELKRVSLNDGTLDDLGRFRIQNLRGASWNAAGQIVGGHVGGTLQLFGAADNATGPASPDQRWPWFIAPGNRALYVSTNSAAPPPDGGQLEAMPWPPGNGTALGLAGTAPQFMAPGYLLFVRSGTLLAAAFDPTSIRVRGNAIPMLQGVSESRVGAAQYSVSQEGTLAYIPGPFAPAEMGLEWLGFDGRRQPLGSALQGVSSARLSPDGRRAAITLTDASGPAAAVVQFDAEYGQLSRVSMPNGPNQSPVWAPDGGHVVFTTSSILGDAIVSQAADGSGTPETLISARPGTSLHPLCVSPNGRQLVYAEARSGQNFHLATLDLANRQARSVPPPPGSTAESDAALSPDGRWLAVQADLNGRDQIWIRSFPDGNTVYPLALDNAIMPRWNPRGGEIFFASGETLEAVTIDTRTGLSSGNPRALLTLPPSFLDYDPGSDGQRIMTVAPQAADGPKPHQIRVILNWRQIVQQRLAAQP